MPTFNKFTFINAGNGASIFMNFMAALYTNIFMLNKL